MGTLLWTIIWSTSRMQLFLVIFTIAIVTAQRSFERGGGGFGGQREIQLQTVGGFNQNQFGCPPQCQLGCQPSPSSECQKLRNNSPWGIIKVIQLPANATFTACNLQCVAFKDERCKFWTMNEVTQECSLFGYPEKFTVKGATNPVVYVSGFSCP